ncbi:MAG TPA: glycoside hydrolase family 57 protein [Candidatus Paceibacterota bacterium]|nr:glycoside hydrolase family 57 protein [Candidatus Paceibacterota bacterium]
MPAVCFYFQVHQPYRLKQYRVFDIGADGEYFNDNSETKRNNRAIFRKVANSCYLPANAVLLQLLHEHPEFKVSFSFSGVFLDQAQEFGPDVLESFQKLVATGQVEVLGETYHHSLAALYSPQEFFEQADLHRRKIKELFGYRPRVFRNTELIYSNAIARQVADLGYAGLLTEGADHVLGWQSPNYIYQPAGQPNLGLLLKNYRLSDDIAFRFSSRDWSQWPLEAPKFASWIHAIDGAGDLVNLFMDYETFGEHQWADTGIFDFLRALPAEILKHPDAVFVTPREALKRFPIRGELDVAEPISWADIERDLSAWRGNDMQRDSLRALYELERDVKATGDSGLIETWRRLQTSDHFYYMCTKWWQDGDVHKYFSPHDSPYDAATSFINALNDLKLRTMQKLAPHIKYA